MQNASKLDCFSVHTIDTIIQSAWPRMATCLSVYSNAFQSLARRCSCAAVRTRSSMWVTVTVSVTVSVSDVARVGVGVGVGVWVVLARMFPLAQVVGER